MFGLAAGKESTGRALDNPALRTEGRVTFIDGVLATAVLGGLVLNAALRLVVGRPSRGIRASCVRTPRRSERLTPLTGIASDPAFEVPTVYAGGVGVALGGKRVSNTEYHDWPPKLGPRWLPSQTFFNLGDWTYLKRE
jgi:hypothetical protein